MTRKAKARPRAPAGYRQFTANMVDLTSRFAEFIRDLRVAGYSEADIAFLLILPFEYDPAHSNPPGEFRARLDRMLAWLERN